MIDIARLDRCFWTASAPAAPPTTLLEDDRETTVVVIGAPVYYMIGRHQATEPAVAEA